MPAAHLAPWVCMAMTALTLFDTAIGHCAVVWGGAGILVIQLPEADVEQTLARIQRRVPHAREECPPPEIQIAIDDIVALTHGNRRDLSAITLDMDGVPEFDRRVYQVTRAIAFGETLTYGEVATRLGTQGQARAVGQALGRNPFAIVVPCHRVTAAGGRAGGFSANGGSTTKLRLLNIEGAMLHRTPTLFDGDPAFSLSLRSN